MNDDLSIYELNNKILVIHNQLDAFRDLDVNTKMYVENNKLVVDTNHFLLQPMVRMFYGYGREMICLFLRQVLPMYVLYTTKIMHFNSVYVNEIEYRRDLLASIKTFYKNIKDGIANLIETYRDYVELAIITRTFNSEMCHILNIY